MFQLSHGEIGSFDMVAKVGQQVPIIKAERCISMPEMREYGAPAHMPTSKTSSG